MPRFAPGANATALYSLVEKVSCSLRYSIEHRVLRYRCAGVRFLTHGSEFRLLFIILSLAGGIVPVCNLLFGKELEIMGFQQVNDRRNEQYIFILGDDDADKKSLL